MTVAAVLAACAGFINSTPATTQSTFTMRLQTYPALATTPNDGAFVKIFSRVGSYGNVSWSLRTNGSVLTPEWQTVFTHLGGYFHPMGVCQPNNGYTSFDSAGGEGVAFAAARNLGFSIAGWLQHLSHDPTVKSNLESAYQSFYGRQITHFFHDVETISLGHPGGHGNTRLLLNPQAAGGYNLHSSNASALDTTYDTGQLSEFELSLGVYLGDFVFGDEATLVTSGASVSGQLTHGWKLVAVSTGYTGTVRFILHSYSNGAVSSASSPALLSREAWGYKSITIRVGAGSDPSKVNATITVDGVTAHDYKTATTLINRPSWNNTTPGLGIGGWLGVGNRNLQVDDVVLKDKSGAVIAYYNFEVGSTFVDANGYITSVADVSNSNATDPNLWLIPSESNLFKLISTNGVPDTDIDLLKTYLIDKPKMAHEPGVAPIQVLTNYESSIYPGQLTFWKPKGLTHGNSAGYVYPPFTTMGSTLVANLLNVTAYPTKSALAEGSDWHSVWLGNVGIPTAGYALQPADYKSYITMMVLQGNRWFPLLGNHWGDASLTSDAQIASVNADVIYAMSLAASWFQSSSVDLQDSAVLSTFPGLIDAAKPADVTAYARFNPSNGKIWLAAFRTTGANWTPTINFGGAGTVTDLTTGTVVYIVGANGLWPTTATPFTGYAKPYLFTPSA